MLIIYDGECPLCRDYVRRIRLEAAAGAVETVDARSEDPRVAAAWAAGYDLDAGMLVELDGRRHHGAEAAAVLAALSTPVDAFNRLNRAVLAKPAVARALYPLFRVARRIALFVTGRGPLRQKGTPAV